MSYETRKDENNNLLVMPLELPMYEGGSSDLCRQAIVSLTSCLRHFAVVDTYSDEGLYDFDIMEYGDIQTFVNQHFEQGTSQLVSCMMALAGIADNYGIDIMQEIYDAPWEV